MPSPKSPPKSSLQQFGEFIGLNAASFISWASLLPLMRLSVLPEAAAADDLNKGAVILVVLVMMVVSAGFIVAWYASSPFNWLFWPVMLVRFGAFAAPGFYFAADIAPVYYGVPAWVILACLVGVVELAVWVTLAVIFYRQSRRQSAAAACPT
jgi:hypothetical protein